MNYEKDPRTGAANPEEVAAETEQENHEPQNESPAEKSKQSDSARTPEPTGQQEDSDKTKKSKENKKQPKRRSDFFKSTKFRHGSISTAFTAGFIAVVVLFNILVGIFGERFPSVNLDLTKNGSNSLSEQGAKVVDSVDLSTNIYVLATKQQVQNDSVGAQYSEVGTLLDKIAERNPKIQVEYMDLDTHPTFAAEYKNDNLSVGDVIVKTDKRYRVLTYSDLFHIQYSQDYSSTKVSSNVEGALVSALNAVISDKLPVVAFETGHKEQQDMSAYQQLLEDNNFEITNFNLLMDEIPENTQMIVLSVPTRDYTDDELQKLSDYLSDKEFQEDRSLMVTFSPSQATLPKLATFLEEWGIQVPQAVVVESDQSRFISTNPSDILSNIQSRLQLKDNNSNNGWTDYGYFVTPQSCPINLLYETKNNRQTYSLAKSSDSCYLVDNDTESIDSLPKQASNTAVLSQETLTNGDQSIHANVIAIGSAAVFAEGIINSGTFGNGTYMVDLAKYATGTNDSSTEVQINEKPLNATDIVMTSQVSTFLGIGIFIIFIPLFIAVLGILVYHKRRNL